MYNWKGKDRTAESIRNPRRTSDIYLHFSTLSEEIKKHANLTSGILLDIGSGTSPYRPYFSHVKKYITLDFFHNKERPDIIGNGLNLPIKNNSVDSVLCTLTLEHIHDPHLFVDEIYRALKPGGICLLSTHMAIPLHALPYDYFRFTNMGLKNVIFKKFSDVQVKECGGSLLSMFQLFNWAIYEKLPKFLSIPLIVPINLIVKPLDKIIHDDNFTTTYLVIAKK
ncbi:MAG: class I SAM-dependent methyltransferase [Nanoarchaeota archaeon]